MIKRTPLGLKKKAGPGKTTGRSEPESDAPGRASALAIKVNATRCPFCHDDVAAKKAWIACAECLARHHKPCWRESKKCASCGGKKPLLPAESAPSRARHSPSDVSRHLKHEGHIRAIAFWHVAGGVLLALAGLLLTLMGLQVSALLLLGLVFLGFGVGCVYAGRSLWTYENGGRTASVILNTLGIFFSLASLAQGDALGALLDMALSGASLWALLAGPSSAIFTPAYRESVKRDSRVKPSWVSSPLFWIPLVLFAVRLVLGFAAAAAITSTLHHHY